MNELLRVEHRVFSKRIKRGDEENEVPEMFK